jgi:hypothetical protein
VEVSGQLSNQSIRGSINAFWALTRDNVSMTSLVWTSPELQPALHTPKRVCRRLGPAEVEELMVADETGVSVNDLAARFKIHRSTVLEHLNRSGTPRRYPALDPTQVEEAARLYRQGKSLRAIGSTSDVTPAPSGWPSSRLECGLRDRNGWDR